MPAILEGNDNICCSVFCTCHADIDQNCTSFSGKTVSDRGACRFSKDDLKPEVTVYSEWHLKFATSNSNRARCGKPDVGLMQPDAEKRVQRPTSRIPAGDEATGRATAAKTARGNVSHLITLLHCLHEV